MHVIRDRQFSRYWAHISAVAGFPMSGSSALYSRCSSSVRHQSSLRRPAAAAAVAVTNYHQRHAHRSGGEVWRSQWHFQGEDPDIFSPCSTASSPRSSPHTWRSSWLPPRLSNFTHNTFAASPLHAEVVVPHKAMKNGISGAQRSRSLAPLLLLGSSLSTCETRKQLTIAHGCSRSSASSDCCYVSTLAAAAAAANNSIKRDATAAAAAALLHNITISAGSVPGSVCIGTATAAAACGRNLLGPRSRRRAATTVSVAGLSSKASFPDTASLMAANLISLHADLLPSPPAAATPLPLYCSPHLVAAIKSPKQQQQYGGQQEEVRARRQQQQHKLLQDHRWWDGKQHGQQQEPSQGRQFLWGSCRSAVALNYVGSRISRPSPPAPGSNRNSSSISSNSGNSSSSSNSSSGSNRSNSSSSKSNSRSRFLCSESSASHWLPMATAVRGFRRFCTSSELLARELERRLTEEHKAGAAYDSQRQGIVLAIADDVLLVRGLAAAPVGTVVVFSQDPAEASRTTSTAVAAQNAAAAAENATAAENVDGAQVGNAKRRRGDIRVTPEPEVLGVVLQLLQQDLNVVGLLGAIGSSSRFCSSAGEYLPFRNPRVGDICTGMSAHDHQQHFPTQNKESQLQPSMHEDGGDQRYVQHQDEQSSPRRRPYKLMDACRVLACGSHAITSPLSLLRRLVPISTSDGGLKACKTPVTFFNALDLSQFSLPSQPSHYQASVQMPWGLPTGSAVVDALAPLQAGEASAFLGPPGTGKTQALVPLVAVHAAAAATAAAAAADAADAAAAGAASGPAGEPLQKRPLLSVIALAFGSSPSGLRRWLQAVSEEVAACSPPVSAAASRDKTSHTAELSAAAKAAAGGETADSGSSTTTTATTSSWFRGTYPGKLYGDGIAASGAAATASDSSSASAGTTADTSLPSLESVVLLHVPTLHEAASDAAAARETEKTDLRGYRIHPTSCLTYLAPILAFRLALEAQAATAVAAAGQTTLYPILLVIDGLEMHAAAVEQLQQNIGKLLNSYSAAVHLPAGVAAGLSLSSSTSRLSPGAASAYNAAASAAVALPYSATSLYGMLASRTSRSVDGKGGPLSVLLVLDTPSDPTVLTARKLQRSSNSLSVQQQGIEETLVQTVRGEDSVGVILSQKVARETQEALLSSAHRTVLFALSSQQQGQYHGVAHAAQKAVQRELQQRQQRVNKPRVEAGCRRKDLFLNRVYPMIDIDSMVTTSTATLSADACMALSQSCFAGKDSLTADHVSVETLRDALKTLCRRQLRAEKQLLYTMPSSSTLSDGAQTLTNTLQGRHKEIKEMTDKRGLSVFEPPALLAAAAAAFAWQRRVLQNESERQELMQQFRLFVDVWEQEDVDSLSIASAVCLARPIGRIFSPSEQLVLLRAAATLFFTPTRELESCGAEKEEGTRHATREVSGVTLTSLRGGSGAIAAGSPAQKGSLSFAQICAFQEDLLQLFQEKEPRLWEDVHQHLHRVGEWPVELQCDMLLQQSKPGTTNKEEAKITSNKVGKNLRSSNGQTSAEEEEQAEHMAQHVMSILNQIDSALLSMRNYFDITTPYFPED